MTKRTALLKQLRHALKKNLDHFCNFYYLDQ